ncbi:PREDICTED: uncharacterized protein LOC105526654 [Colobus angolensis palliatus]|uniref:uncharacterized protein LOC105526654 n=1 Tax=Colobus angolensis palliatus TaxID=336983 RepID=UPI0005F5441D|nr:PREDICTED: uncharacterized protein LOC105526654 [Colobus angolensis palliatus]
MLCGRERLAVGLVSRQGRAIALPSWAGMARQGWHGSRCPVLRKPVIAGPRRCSPQFFGPGFLQVGPAYQSVFVDLAASAPHFGGDGVSCEEMRSSRWPPWPVSPAVTDEDAGHRPRLQRNLHSPAPSACAAPRPRRRPLGCRPCGSDALAGS